MNSPKNLIRNLPAILPVNFPVNLRFYLPANLFHLPANLRFHLLVSGIFFVVSTLGFAESVQRGEGEASVSSVPLPIALPSALPNSLPSILPSILPSALPSILPSALPDPTQGALPSAAHPADELPGLRALALARVHLEGTLLERGTRKPLEGVSVYVLPQKLKAQTTLGGKFVIDQETPEKFEGEFKWVVNFPGYQKLTLSDQSEDTTPRTLYLERETYQVYETTIVGQQGKNDDTSKTLGSVDFLQAPGSGGDPVKAVQNLTGVNRPTAFSSQVIIQGAEPNDSKYSLEGQEIPLVFHFGGLTSIVIPQAIDRVETLFAGYGPDSGRALAGWVNLWTRSPQTDRLHGLGFFDLYSAGGLIEGPLGKGADDHPGGFLISVRQSYFGLLLKQIFKNNSDFNLTLAPEYSDMTALYEIQLSAQDDFKTTFFASQDSLGFLIKEPVKSDPSIRGDFSSSTAFFRVIPRWTHRFDRDTLSSFSLGVGKDWISFVNGSTYFRLAGIALTTRGNLEHSFSSEFKSSLGFDHRYRWSNVGLSLPVVYSSGGIANPLSSGASQVGTVSNQNSVIGLYTRNEWTPGDSNWTILANLRFDAIALTHEAIVSPRPGLRYRWSPSLVFKALGGLYVQPPAEQEISAEFGNPNLRAPRAWHFTLGAENDFRGGRTEGWVLTSDLFFKWLDQLVISSTDSVTTNGVTVPLYFSNDGKGRIIGLQNQLKYSDQNWALTLNYTLSQSRRWNSSVGMYSSAYDQTHVLSVLGSRELGRNWKLSGRFRFVTGNPITPVDSALFDSDNDVYLPVRGSIFSQRLPNFLQLDLRLDKKWIFNSWILSFYLDVQNATNQKNTEQIQYAYDFSSSTGVTGLPVIPTLGLKGEF